jgi:predicted DNA-binding protein
MPSDFHVQFSPEEAGLFAHMASMEKKPVDILLQELALEALEKREDFYLSKLADALYREQEGQETYSHEEAWKQ